MKQNGFWMSNLFDAYYNGNDPKAILQKDKQADELTSKMIQDAAKKYVTPNKYIRMVLKPEATPEKKAF
jgi:zinc protease